MSTSESDVPSLSRRQLLSGCTGVAGMLLTGCSSSPILFKESTQSNILPDASVDSQADASAACSIAKLRADGLCAIDSTAPIRRSSENPDIIAVYRDFLGGPLSAKAEQLLHTTYTPR